MGYNKRIAITQANAQERAILSHKKFVEFVSSEVEKRGIRKVLVCSDRKDKWLLDAFERVLDFAEQVQLKQIAQKLEGSGENGEFVLKIEISDENKASQQPGNRIQEYLEV